MTRLVITGATGYVGRRLVRAAASRAIEVVAATRSRPSDPRVAWIPYRLEGPPPDLPENVRAVVHLAAATRGEIDAPAGADEKAARRLVEAASRRGLRLVFVSSQAARPDAPTDYGRTKWAIERLVLDAGGCVVRPGLVYGGEGAGLFRALERVVRERSVLPALLPAPKVQPIHVADLAEGLLAAALAEDTAGRVFALGAPEPVSFTRFLQSLASVRLRRRRVFLPVPAPLALRAVRAAPGIVPGAAERLRSLVDLHPMETAASLGSLGLTLRPLDSGMSRSGSSRRRELLREGGAFAAYLLGERAPGSVVRRYVRAVESLRDGRRVPLPDALLAFPSAIAILDDERFLARTGGAEIAWRLSAAAVVAEASPAGARRFLLLEGDAGFVRAASSALSSLAAEALCRITRLAAGPFLARDSGGGRVEG